MLLYFGIITFILGILFKMFYKNNVVHNTIFYPILILGLLSIMISIYGFIQSRNVLSISELKLEDISTICITNIYNNDSINCFCFENQLDRIAFLDALKKRRKIYNQNRYAIVWYIDIAIKVKSNNSLMVRIHHTTENGYIIKVIKKYWYITTKDERYWLNNSIEDLILSR